MSLAGCEPRAQTETPNKYSSFKNASNLQCIGGRVRALFPTHEKYLPVTMAIRWTQEVDGGPRRVNHAAVAVRNRFIFSFGGYCTGEEYNSIKKIDVHVFDTGKKWLFAENVTRCPCKTNSLCIISRNPQLSNIHSSISERLPISDWEQVQNITCPQPYLQ